MFSIHIDYLPLKVLCWIVAVRNIVVHGYYFGREYRFSDGNSDSNGPLKIRYQNQWGYICADGFGLVEGGVVCKNTAELYNLKTGGYKAPALEVYPVSNYSRDTTPIILDGVKCNGFEDRLYECQHNGFFNASCPSSSIVGLRCARRGGLINYVEDTDIRRNRSSWTRTLLGFNDPLTWSSFTKDRFRTTRYIPYWWGYVCDIPKKYRKGVIHCEYVSHEADYAFYTENSAVFEVWEPDCTGDEAREIHCGTLDECSEVNNNSVICIADESEMSLETYSGRWLIQRLRLVGGTTSEGRLEVSWGGGIWGSVCSKFWGLGSARFVCQHLGFSGVEYYGTIEVNASYPMLQYLSCNDEDETYWDDCLHRYTRPEEDVCLSYVTVKCSDFANEGNLRLTGAAIAGEGQVEIFRDGVWGGVKISDVDASPVVCNQLGYSGRNGSYAKIEYELNLDNPALLDISDCKGNEASVLDCDHRWYNPSEIRRSPSAIRCNHPEIFRPRLYNGTSIYEGRLELWEGNQWRRVCSLSIGGDAGDIICKQLGHKSLETFYNWPKFGNGINPVLSWSIHCDHMVTFLNQCDFSYLTTRKLDCYSVALKCIKMEKTMEHRTRNRILFGVAFGVFGVVTAAVLAAVLVTLRRKCMRNNDATDESHTQDAQVDRIRLSTISPGVNRPEQHFHHPDDTPPPPYSTLYPNNM